MDATRGGVPGRPPGSEGGGHRPAEGVPLFAVETVRALIDRDIVQPIEGLCTG